MADQEGGVDLAFHDRVEQPGQIVLDVRLPGLQRQSLLHEGAVRESIHDAAIDGGHRDAVALAARNDRLTDGVNAIGAEEGGRFT